MRYPACVISLLFLLAAGCGARRETALKVDPELLPMVPADTVTLLGVKVDQVRSAPVYRKYGPRLEGSWVGTFEARTGLDPHRNVREVVGAIRDEHSLLLVRGNFGHQSGFQFPMPQPDARRFDYKGHTLIGSEKAAITILNSSTLVAGHAPAVRQMIDRRGRTEGPSQALLAAIGKIPGGSQIWIASTAGPAAAAARVSGQEQAPQLAVYLDSVRSYYGGVSLRDGLSVEGRVECATPGDAGNLARIAKTLVGLGRLNVPDHQPELLRFFDGIRVEQDQSSVLIRIQADEAGFEKAVEFLTRESSGAGVMPSIPGLLR